MDCRHPRPHSPVCRTTHPTLAESPVARPGSAPYRFHQCKVKQNSPSLYRTFPFNNRTEERSLHPSTVMTNGMWSYRQQAGKISHSFMMERDNPPCLWRYDPTAVFWLSQPSACISTWQSLGDEA